ncbi:hypothetical protein A3860_13225 [Niastella vici]|uniref:Methylamine utilisation protein MauE domain-containing protein n=1 Tax=Niastella vici TaxID=1703345 RepID=A0A1V9G799_9BACT|nr:MauE/DoxX family redox-associated membrane protein [Niastella vici]OQP66447.1 hypothetical protein A3860_13225 [Niastella vici]
MNTKALVKLIAIALAVLFAIAAVDKLEHYPKFSLQLQSFPVDLSVLSSHAWFIPVTELILAVLLLLPFTRLKGLFASLFLLGLYTLYLVCMLETRFHSICNCGEPFQSLSLKMHIALTLAAVFVTGVGVVLSGQLVEEPLPKLGAPQIVKPYYEHIDTSLVNSRN